MKIVGEINFPNSKELQKMLGLDADGEVQKYIDNFVIKESGPYLPGGVKSHLANSAYSGYGLVIWDSPDANYLYEGKLMVDPKTGKGAFYSPSYGFWSRPNTEKILDPNKRELVYHKGGGSHWFDRMIENKFDDMMNGIEHIVNGDK